MILSQFVVWFEKSEIYSLYIFIKFHLLSLSLVRYSIVENGSLAKAIFDYAIFKH